MKIRVLIILLLLVPVLLPAQNKKVKPERILRTKRFSTANYFFGEDHKYINVRARSIKTWNMTNGKFLWKKRFPVSKIVSSSKKGEHLLFAGPRKWFRKGFNTILFDPANATVLREQTVLVSRIRAISFASDTSVCAVLRRNNSIVIWDLRSEKNILNFPRSKSFINSIDVSSNGQYLAITGSSMKCEVFDLFEGGKLIYSDDYSSWGRTVKFSPDGKLLGAGDDKGNLFIYEFTSGPKPIALKTQFSTRGGRVCGISFDKENQFIACADHKGWVYAYAVEKEKQTFTFDCGKKQTMIAPAFSEANRFFAFSANLKRTLYVFDFRNPEVGPMQKLKYDKDIVGPMIAVSSPVLVKDRFKTDLDQIKLKGVAIDDFGIKEASINGKPLNLDTKGEFEITIPLAMGDNQFKIEAKDLNNNGSSKVLTIVRDSEFDFTGAKVDAKNYLLLIGIDHYKHWPALSNAVSDAVSFNQVLMDKYAFMPENITTVLDSNATRKNIYDSFKMLVEKITPNDNLIIYYSGHGHYDPVLGEGYWVPVDAGKGEESDYIPNGFINQFMKKINSKHTFLIADACFSGSLFENSSRGYSENVEQFKSRWGLTSGRLEFVSDGNAGDHSPFNEAIVEFLKNNTKPTLPISELIQKVKVDVSNKTSQTPIGNPLKSAGDEGGEFVFKIKK